MMLDAFASYLGDLLKQTAEEELGMMLGVSGDIDKMGVKLGGLKNLLADAERRRITDDSVQQWVTELKRAMYEATDILDLCQLKIMERGSSTPDIGCCNPLLFCLRNPRFTHEIGGCIKKLNQTLDSINVTPNMRPYPKGTRRAACRKTDPVLERLGVVGEKIEDDTRTLVEKLTNKDDIDDIMLVAIVGVGGIGKTTLAKKVFNDEAIQHGFNTKIWLSVTKQFSEAELLKTAIITAKGKLPDGGAQDKSLLVPALAVAIKDKKFFLVLDDMWGDNEWNNLLKDPFSYGAPSSRVLPCNPYHHVDKLGPEDAWSLLTKQVRVTSTLSQINNTMILTTEKSEPTIDMLKDIGLQIIEKCDGLPLAIKVMGGLLCQKEKSRHAWGKLLNDAAWSVSQMPEELNNAIYLSYEDLSPCLKQCFLHFSLKPKKTMFQDCEYVGMWIGEGFVHGDSDRLEELGFEYHKELVLRNLIEPDTSYPRSFAQYVSRNESLVLNNGESTRNTSSMQRYLRLSVETKGVESDTFELRSLQEQKSLRSIMLIGNFKIQPGDSLVIFSSLRTLHMESIDCVALLECLHQLKHLRYLAVKNCNGINSLPDDIHKIKLLQHLSFDSCGNLVSLPNSIVKLQELRYLDLDGTCVTGVPRGFHALRNLRTIFGFPAQMDGDWCSLEELGPLSHLRCIRLVGLQNVSASSFARKARLCEKVHLSILRLNCSSGFGDDEQKKGSVSEKDQRVIRVIEEALACMALGKSGPEWDKFGHIQHVEAYADDLGAHIEKKWHLFYTSEPYSMEWSWSETV
ncbi:hypothetical protein VPH35_070873 [Triticum aestivum]